MVYTGLAEAMQAPAVQATAVQAARNEKFLEHDPSGIGITLISMSVVFVGLIFLSVVFILLGRFNARKRGDAVGARGVKKGQEGALAAVIGLALYEHERSLRDDEIVSVTIKEISRRYSPWSSKSYAVLHNRLRR